MDIALKLAEILIPLIWEAVQKAHPDKSADEHKQIVNAIVDQHVEKQHAVNSGQK